MDLREIQAIQQRLMEGYYEADCDTLLAMQLLLDTVKRLRDEDHQSAGEELS
jgi:hypothetical protein